MEKNYPIELTLKVHAESDLLILEQLDASMAEAHEDGDYDNASDGTASDVVGFYDMGDGDNEELMREVLQKTSR